MHQRRRVVITGIGAITPIGLTKDGLWEGLRLGRSAVRTVTRFDPLLALAVFGGASSCNIAIELGVQGPNSTNAMSCASGTIAVGEAFRQVRDGYADVMFAGAAEAPLMPLCFGAFA